MSQSYSLLPSSTQLTASLPILLARDDAAASSFAGTAFPSANLLLGQVCYRTDQAKMYQLTQVTPSVVWTLVYDLSSGSGVMAAAAAVPWSGVSGKPTTISGYGITDALSKAGDTATGKINLVASASGAASLGVPHGAAPSAPANGDLWSTTSGFFVRVNGNTFTLSMLQASEAFTAKKTFLAASSASASLNIPPGAAPTTPVDGDIWATTTALNVRMSGATRSVSFADQLGALALLSTVGTAQIADNAVTGAKIAMGSDARGDILYYNGTDYARLPPGTSGQYLKTNGAGADPAWASVAAGAGQIAPVTLSAGAGDTQGITGIPSTAKIVFFHLTNATLSNALISYILLGTSGGYVTTNYWAANANIAAAAVSVTTGGSPAPGFRMSTDTAGQALRGVVMLVNLGGNSWSCSFTLAAISSPNKILTGGGYVDLGGTLDRVAIQATSGGNWTGGTISVTYI